MPELGTLGSVRGALSNERPYRDHATGSKNNCGCRRRRRRKLWWRELHLEAVAAECALRLKSVNMKKWNQGRARPSRSNCSDHSAGASRKVATPMPRGSRPSTAALTRAGAMNAIDIVMLT